MHFISRQTHADGRVNYGRPITYAKIAREIPNCPPERTLRRYVKILRERYIDAQVVNVRGVNKGMIVRILRPKKWAEQLPLFAPETGAKPVQKPVDAPVDSLLKSAKSRRPLFVRPGGQMWPPSTCIKESTYEKNKSRAQEPRGASPPASEENAPQEPDGIRLIEPTKIPDSVRELARRKSFGGGGA